MELDPLSRPARSTRDTLASAARLERAGADRVSLSEHSDTTSAAGTMASRLLVVRAEIERDLVSERTRTALAYKRGQSRRVGQVPYGFDLDPGGPINTRGRPARLLPNAREQDVIAGIPTKRGRGPWIHTAVAKILKRKSNQ